MCSGLLTVWSQSELHWKRLQTAIVLRQEKHLCHKEQIAPIAGHQWLVSIGPPSNDCVQECGKRQEVQAHIENALVVCRWFGGAFEQTPFIQPEGDNAVDETHDVQQRHPTCTGGPKRNGFRFDRDISRYLNDSCSCCVMLWYKVKQPSQKNTKPIPVPHHATWIHANDKYHRECLSHPQGQVPWRKHIDFVQTCLNYFSTCNATWQARLHDEGHDQRWHGCAKDLVIECQTGTATWHCELTACPPHSC